MLDCGLIVFNNDRFCDFEVGFKAFIVFANKIVYCTLLFDVLNSFCNKILTLFLYVSYDNLEMLSTDRLIIDRSHFIELDIVNPEVLIMVFVKIIEIDSFQRIDRDFLDRN